MTGRGANPSARSDRTNAIFVAVTVAIIALNAVAGPQVTATISWLLLATLGIPHGAFDSCIARQLFGTQPTRQLAFFVVYIGAVIAGVVAWKVVPILTGIGFLIGSIYHFGEAEFDRTKAHRVELAISRGTALVLGAVLWHFHDLQAVLSVPGWRPHSYMNFASWVLFGLHAVHLAYRLPKTAWRNAFIVYCAQAALLATLDPQSAFILFLSLWHAVAHISALRASGIGRRIQSVRITALAFGLSLAAVMLVGGLFVALFAVDTLSNLGAEYAIVLLSSLTFPHMVLVEMWRFSQRVRVT